jgi:hypothetical protein
MPMIERRSFLVSCSWFVAAAASPTLLLRAGASEAPAPSSPVAGPPRIAVRVQGWDEPDPTGGPALWISVGTTWRAALR